MTIREAAKEDFDSIWPIFREIVKAGETYAYAADTTKAQAFKIWIEAPRKTYVFEEEGNILGLINEHFEPNLMLYGQAK